MDTSRISNLRVATERCNMKILCVDDEALMLRLLGLKLRDMGYEPLTTSDPSQALEIIEKQDIRLVVCDWYMPEIDGLKLCQMIRSQPRQTYIYFIMITAQTGDDNYNRAMACGVDDFLTKPLNHIELKNRLRVAERILGFTNELIKLKEFIPVCSYCRKIRDEDSSWMNFEQFISKKIGTRFSHGICPTCYETTVKKELECMSEPDSTNKNKET